MGNQSSAIDKAVKISIIVSALLVACSVAYYFIFFLPKYEALTFDQKRQEQELQLKKYEEQKEDLSIERKKAEVEQAESLNKFNNCISQAKSEINHADTIWSKYQKDNCDSQENVTVLTQCLTIVDTKLKEAVASYDQAEKNCYLKFPTK